MKPLYPSQSKARCRGYVSLAMVAVIATVTGLGLIYSFRRGIQGHDAQSMAQVKIDHAQKEDAFLRALVATVPNRAIGVMRDNSAATAPSFSWQQIFQDAIELANAEEAVDSVTLSGLGLGNVIVANPGDGAISNVADVISPVMGGDGGLVNSGTEVSNALLLSNQFGGRLPDPLSAPSGVTSLDGNYPIISRDKVFSTSYTNDAQLSPGDYPLYNIIPYPNIRFGYKGPGEPFVAKRNWWAFSVNFGDAYPNAPGPGLTKHYVVSIYEIPSQMPISADAFMTVGRHADGTTWQNAAIDGGISAGILETDAMFDLPSGQLTSRDAMIVGSGTTVLGRSVNGNFDDLGVREILHADQANDQYVASLSANSGRVAFVPINRGLDFYRIPEVEEGNMISTTGWDAYSTGAPQCEMKLLVTGVKDPLDQTPMKLEWEVSSGGGTSTMTFEREVNWPYPLEPGGDTFPFQTEHLETGRKALVVFMERIAPYLANEGHAGPAANHSLAINPAPSRHPDIKVPEFPTVGTDMAVVLRDTNDFSPYTEGFALVTNLRLYIGDDFNQVAVAPPAGSGIPAGKVFFPPVALFAPEQRFGTTLKIRPVDYQGQVNSLAEGENFAIHPLDFRAGTYETVTPGLINADLKPIDSPAELAPIYLMNWLVTVEELRPDPSGSN